MADFPKSVEFHEEGPREGFQIEKTIYPIEKRVEFLNLLSETGLKQIQVGSMVNPKKVPPMADTPWSRTLWTETATAPLVRAAMAAHHSSSTPMAAVSPAACLANMRALTAA